MASAGLALLQICSERLDLGAGLFERAGAVDGVRGVLEFFFNGKLNGDAAAGLGFAHASGAQAFELLLGRAPGNDEAVEPWGHACFDKQSGFDEGGMMSTTFLAVLELIENDLVDAWVKDGIEACQFGWIGEDDCSEFVTVDLAGRVGKVGAECFEDFIVGGLAGFHEFVREGIGVKNGEAKFAENGGDHAFAAGNTTGEAEFQHWRRCAPSETAASLFSFLRRSKRLVLQPLKLWPKILTGARLLRWWRGVGVRPSPCYS